MTEKKRLGQYTEPLNNLEPSLKVDQMNLPSLFFCWMMLLVKSAHFVFFLGVARFLTFYAFFESL